MLITPRRLVAALAVVAIGIVPAGAIAKHDDPPGDDNGGLRDDGVSDDTGFDDNGGDRARTGDDARRRETRVVGRCSGRARSKLKAKLDDGRIEVEFEVDQNRNGRTWKVVIRRNGQRVVRTRATTRAPSGSFSVERKIANPPGADRLKARAVNRRGQVCKAALTI